MHDPRGRFDLAGIRPQTLLEFNDGDERDAGLDRLDIPITVLPSPTGGPTACLQPSPGAGRETRVEWSDHGDD
jgi:hypothetical protein